MVKKKSIICKKCLIIDTDERRAKPLCMTAGNQSFCLLTYYPFDGVDALHLLICNTIMNYKFITFVIHDI